MSLTTKQIQILTLVCRGNPDDPSQKWCDLDQVLERLETEFAWVTTKQSIQFSIRTLVEKHEMIVKGEPERRRGRRRVVLIPTDLGYQIAGYSGAAESTDEDDDFGSAAY